MLYTKSVSQSKPTQYLKTLGRVPLAFTNSLSRYIVVGLFFFERFYLGHKLRMDPITLALKLVYSKQNKNNKKKKSTGVDYEHNKQFTEQNYN